ncbi:MAG: hypothetical protein ACRDP7_28540, partial [Trebonia sp.]
VEVAALGQRLAATADEINSAAQRLRTMCTDTFWDSGAGEAFRARSVATAGKLAAAFDRYQAAAIAIGSNPADSAPSTGKRPNYAGALDQAQALSLRALTPAQDAATTQQITLTRLRTEYGPSLSPLALVPGASGHLPPVVALGPLPAGALGDADTVDIAALVRQYNTAADTITAARSTLTRATEIRDAAAANAAALIDSAISSDGLADSAWDRFTNFIDEHAGLISAVSSIAGWVATVTGTLALLVGWIPIVGQALAAVLGTVALAASVVAFLSDVLLKIGGKGSWADLALDTIAVASFGLGRAAVGAVKDSAILARATGRIAEFTSRVSEAVSGDIYLSGGEEALDRLLPDMWKATNEEFDNLEESAIRTAREHAPGAWPNWGEILRGFYPRSIIQDGFKDIGDLRLSDWKQLGTKATWADAKFFVGDPEIHEALEGVEKLGSLSKLDSVRGFVANVASNHNMWRFVTAPAVATDIANHVLSETGLKDGLLHDVGLGWAAEAAG